MFIINFVKFLAVITSNILFCSIVSSFSEIAITYNLHLLNMSHNSWIFFSDLLF